jgi:hypothetical protein
MTTWSVRSSTLVGIVGCRASWSSGNMKTGSARKTSATPMTSMRMTKRFIVTVFHGESDPYPVAVNVSTTCWSDSTYSRPSAPSRWIIP